MTPCAADPKTDAGATFSPTDPNDQSGLSAQPRSPVCLDRVDGKLYPAGHCLQHDFWVRRRDNAGCKVGFIPGSDINPVSAKLTQMFVPAPNAGLDQTCLNSTQLLQGKEINT